MAVHKIDGAGISGVSHFPKKFITLYAAAACTASDWAAIDLDDSTNGLGASVEQATTALPQLVCGIFAETTTAAGNVSVQLAGKHTGANVYATVTAGDILGIGAVAGRAVELDHATVVVASNSAPDIRAALQHNACGVALSTAVGTTAAVMIMDQGYFG